MDDGKLFGAGTPTFAVGPKGEAYAFIRERPDRPPAPAPRPVQRLFMIKSVDQGRTWSGNLVNPGQVFIYQPVPAVDRNGNMSLVWFQGEGQTLDVPTQIRFTTSKDGGRTWSDPVELTDDDPAGKFNQYWPGMSVAPSGRIDVAWHDFRGDPYYVPTGVGPMGLGSTSQQFSNIYYTYSTDGGKTWAPNIRVSDRSIYRRVGITFNNQDVVGPVGMASTDDGAVITWSDSRGSAPFDAEDAYVTRVRFDDGTLAGAAAEEDDESPVVWVAMGAGIALGVAGAVFAVASRALRRPRSAVPA
jgi:Neuraminidase (sialidase)